MPKAILDIDNSISRRVYNIYDLQLITVTITGMLLSDEVYITSLYSIYIILLSYYYILGL